MEKTVLYFGFLLFFAGFILCQRDNEIIDDLEKKIKSEIPEFSDFNTTTLPVEEAEKAIQEKCEKNGGPNAFTELKAKEEHLKECFTQLFDVEIIQEELKVAEKTGSMDEVFGKYCNKYPEFNKCLEEVHTAIIPCLEEQEKPTLNKAFNVTTSIVQFACHKNGDRIAMFVAEGGIECLNSKKDQLQLCVNNTVGDKIPQDMSAITNEALGPVPIPLFVLEDKNIKEFDELHTCFRETLETCEESTPANVIDALFKYVRKLLFIGAGNELTAAESKSKNGNAGTIPVVAITLLLFTSLVTKLM